MYVKTRSVSRLKAKLKEKGDVAIEQYEADSGLSRDEGRSPCGLKSAEPKKTAAGSGVSPIGKNDDFLEGLGKEASV